MDAAGVPTTNEEAWAIASRWASGREMSAFEALMWRAEADPRLRSTMMVVDVLDGVPDWDRLVAAHEWGSRLVPRARQRVVEPPLGLGSPTWVTDRDFDLSYHLRRVRLPAPGTLRQLLDIAQSEGSSPFDRARSPWRAALVEGLEGDRAAYVLKIHHSITDGQGGVQLTGLLHSRKREPSPDKPMPEPPEPENASPLGVLGDQAARAALGAPREALRRGSDALAVARRLATSPWEGVTEAARFGRSLQRVLAPPPAPPSPLLAERSLSWRFGALEAGLDELKRAGKAAGGTLNDAYIAALLGGFRRYHERFDVEIDCLPMAMPISMRSGDHPMGGNRFAGARFAAPVGEPDPAERIRIMRELVLSTRDEPALDAVGLLAPALSRLPAPLMTRAWAAQTTQLDLQASNVPGLPYRAYIAGARIERMLPFGPLPGCAVMATLLSYAGTCSIGVNCDAAAVKDPELFMGCLQEGLDEVLALARPRSRRAAPAAQVGA